jgi:glycosyltransferase involved in cell wall biosynthesis
VFPFIGGGLSRYVTATADTLASVGEVTIVTTSRHERRYEELRKAGSPQLSDGVRFVFVREPRPREIGNFNHHLHLWSARVCEALRETYRDAPPDLVEFPDYHAEGFVSVQAKRGLDPVLRHACMCIRLYTSSEMTSVLNGYVSSDLGATILHDIERYALRHADRILWPGGDIYGTYERFYGGALAPGVLVHHPVLSGYAAEGSELDAPEGDGPLRLLYLGRFERRKGVQNLLRAATALERDDWRLTLVGGDTPTASLGTSMRSQLELMAADDPRIRFRKPARPEEVPSILRSHHVGVFPSLWECWPNVVLEAFSHNRPVLATPTGGFLGMVEEGRSGWLTHDRTATSLLSGLERLLDGRDELVDLTRRRGPREAFERLTARDHVREVYLRLVDENRKSLARAAKRRRRPAPLVSIVIPYFELEAYVEETIASAFEQTHRELEVIVVNDGSFREADRILEELTRRYPVKVVAQQNSGLGAARNFGISQSRGRYVFPLDADDVVAPTFVERCVEVLEDDEGPAYATAWSRFIDEKGKPLASRVADYAPIGNAGRGLDTLNVAGSAEAVFRKRVFDLGYWYDTDLTSYEDWMHFRELDRAGFHGHVIPEVLLWYRVRRESMLRSVAHRAHDRIVGEMEAHLRAREVAWKQ